MGSSHGQLVPIEQRKKFKLATNRKTAMAPGLAISQSPRTMADTEIRSVCGIGFRQSEL
jgi:hypothetical protein